jgi:predicted DNA-binding transcriptional regulator AlpA
MPAILKGLKVTYQKCSLPAVMKLSLLGGFFLIGLGVGGFDNIFWSHPVTNNPPPPPASYQIHRFKRPDTEQPRRLARKAGTCRYLGRSQMTLWRWMHDQSLGFPKPICIRDVEYFDLDEVDAWLKERVVA